MVLARVVPSHHLVVHALQQCRHRLLPPVTHATPYVLRVTRLPVGRRASGFVLVAKG